VSSAHTTILALFVGILGKSLIYGRKNTGPGIDPYGTPRVTISQPDEMLFWVSLLSTATF
jgi:hypothetical protein